MNKICEGKVISMDHISQDHFISSPTLHHFISLSSLSLFLSVTHSRPHHPHFTTIFIH
ncbi:hypothetical protein HanXRQr2_Chr01g0012671 [Helianthus annuus]|uniref:Uncharacterized protein n=1 Tax=Helianthus annuus TaxID=4232 RepID=A0A251VLU6_HELAN|nr:hypothetical protein HanXRQr2_Chr01g0012671 [Helianthus annuus]KAJ0621914.1 hypothetical protein HanIR_Chr01g0014151 [Helianthus annuus]